MEDRIHDCIVVGAGSAGPAAAVRMARDGLDVVLLERAPLQRCITGGYETYISPHQRWGSKR